MSAQRAPTSDSPVTAPIHSGGGGGDSGRVSSVNSMASHLSLTTRRGRSFHDRRSCQPDAVTRARPARALTYHGTLVTVVPPSSTERLAEGPSPGGTAADERDVGGGG